jgi:hypothetical protein
MRNPQEDTMTEHAKDKEMIARMNSAKGAVDSLTKFIDDNNQFMNGDTARELTVTLHGMMSKAHQLLATCEQVKAHRDKQAEAAAKLNQKMAR